MTADWKATRVYMMDFEGSPRSGVVEFGIVVLLDGGIEFAETALCRPAGLITEREQEVHGLRQGDVAGRAPFSASYGKFVDFRRQGVYAAHNRHAENGFLKSTWPLPPEVPDWRRGGGTAQEWGPWIDTLSLYRALYPGLEGYGLGDLVDRFESRPELEALAERHCPPTRRKPHCALYDALASALLLLRLEQEPALAGRLTLGWLLQVSEGRSPQQELF